MSYVRDRIEALRRVGLRGCEIAAVLRDEGYSREETRSALMAAGYQVAIVQDALHVSNFTNLPTVKPEQLSSIYWWEKKLSEREQKALDERCSCGHRRGEHLHSSGDCSGTDCECVGFRKIEGYKPNPLRGSSNRSD